MSGGKQRAMSREIGLLFLTITSHSNKSALARLSRLVTDVKDRANKDRIQQSVANSIQSKDPYSLCHSCLLNRLLRLIGSICNFSLSVRLISLSTSRVAIYLYTYFNLISQANATKQSIEKVGHHVRGRQVGIPKVSH